MKRVDKQYLKIIEKDDTVSTLKKLPYFGKEYIRPSFAYGGYRTIPYRTHSFFKMRIRISARSVRIHADPYECLKVLGTGTVP